MRPNFGIANRFSQFIFGVCKLIGSFTINITQIVELLCYNGYGWKLFVTLAHPGANLLVTPPILQAEKLDLSRVM